MGTTFVLRNAWVLDESGSFSGPTDIVVAEGRVSEVGQDPPAPPGAAVHDFAGLWVMPGVFDCHDHPTWSTTNETEAIRTPITQWVLECASNLRRTLEAGVTFVRDAAGADAGIREAIDRGYIPGPRMQVSLNLLCETGGHGDGFLIGPGIDWGFTPDWLGRPPTLVDGVDEMRRVVRQLLRSGVDWIKLCATGGIVSPHDSGDQPQLTQEEIRTAVIEADRKGKRVMAHAFGGEGLTAAVRAGVRSVEHGYFVTEEQADEMAAAGCWLVPTLAILREVVRWAEEAAAGFGNPLPEYSIRKALAVKPLIGDAVKIAKAAGVPIALGTDYINRAQHGRNLEELLFMREAGLTVEEALLAGTIRGAELCGVSDRFGRIAPGYVFDAIVVNDDPGDLSLFARPGCVAGVFKGGVPVVPHERLELADVVSSPSLSGIAPE
jgi:imidazolonepropionase-like amidohydrolase